MREIRQQILLREVNDEGREIQWTDEVECREDEADAEWREACTTAMADSDRTRHLLHIAHEMGEAAQRRARPHGVSLGARRG